ncbi:unnamed protein product [Hymenolepis diminuta]|uniref:Uncharacterized protein n=1 Tax=Hymenolepis diminuta TaxID=6216 RepID=A0A3P7BN61_HYMDI|nr:unnamed protein product [Hymenolepis diminuta]
MMRLISMRINNMFVTLEGTQLRIQRPRKNVPRRAMFNVSVPSSSGVQFVHQRIYDMRKVTVSLLPEGLVAKRFWSKKYPICLTIQSEQVRKLHYFDYCNPYFNWRITKTPFTSLLNEPIVTNVEMGNELPVITNVGKPYLDNQGLWFELEVVYTGGFTVSFQTTVIFFAYSIFTLVNIPPPPSNRLWYGFRGNPNLRVKVKSKVGEYLFNFPRILEIIEKRIITEFQVSFHKSQF